LTKRTAPTVPQPCAATPDLAPELPSDCIDELPPPARRILVAARHILRERGLAAMSLQAVATEAGQVKPSIAYYFGDKAGLVSMVVRSLIREANSLAKQWFKQLPDGDAKVAAFVDELRELSLDEGTTLEFLEILPWAARREQMGSEMLNLYAWARELNANALGGADVKASADELLSWGVLSAAILDGLAMQKVVGVEDDLIDRAWEEWRRMLLLVRSAGTGAGT